MISIKDLTISFGRVHALRHLDLSLNPGECILLAGANGAGKTTLLRSIMGVLRTHPGTVFVAGKSVGPHTRRRCAYIPASLSGYDSMKIGECMKLHAASYPEFQLPDLKGVRLTPGRKLSTLSRGERALFFLGMGLATSPDYVLIDDVLHYLDPHLREVFLDALLRAVEERSTTVIIASQSPIEVEGLVERVIMIRDGQLTLDRKVEDLKQEFLRIYSDSPPGPDLPVVYQRRWSGIHEWYLYPWTGPPPPGVRAEHLALSDILKALIGGHYASQ